MEHKTSLNKSIMMWPLRSIEHGLVRAQRYTKLVVISKIGMLALASLILSAVIIVPLFNNNSSTVDMVFSEQDSQKDATPVMVNPRFSGLTAENKNFTLTALTATQQDAETVLLDKVQGEVDLDNKDNLRLSADKALLHVKKRLLLLNENIMLTHSDGYVIKTARATVDLDKRTAVGDVLVTGDSPTANLTAGGFRVTERDGRIIFTEPVRLTIKQ